MNKLTTLLAVATLALAVGACKKKRETEQKDDTTATHPADEPKPAPEPDDKPKPPEAAAAVPAECTAYKELADKLATCEKLPQKARDALKATYDNAAKAWATPPTDDAAKKTIADTCKSNTDALRSAAAAPCGW
jgi:hypothetical protein